MRPTSLKRKRQDRACGTTSLKRKRQDPHTLRMRVRLAGAPLVLAPNPLTTILFRNSGKIGKV